MSSREGGAARRTMSGRVDVSDLRDSDASAMASSALLRGRGDPKPTERWEGSRPWSFEVGNLAETAFRLRSTKRRHDLTATRPQTSDRQHLQADFKELHGDPGRAPARAAIVVVDATALAWSKRRRTSLDTIHRRLQ